MSVTRPNKIWWTTTEIARAGLPGMPTRTTGVDAMVTRGDKASTLKLRHKFSIKAEAQRAAQSALDRSVRASGTISVRLAGFWGDLSAEGIVDLQGIKPELCGEWHIKRVQHNLDKVLITSFDAERDNEKDKK